MGLTCGSQVPVTIQILGVGDLSGVGVTEITIAFARQPGQTPAIKKTKTGAGTAGITVAYDGVTDTNTLTCVLTATETAGRVGDLCYAIYVDEGAPEGPWTPNNGGTGTLTFADAVKIA